MVLVDTNVLFSLVVENDLYASAVVLYERDDDWHSEPHAFVELTNVFARYVRNRMMSVEEARLALARAESVIGEESPSRAAFRCPRQCASSSRLRV